jgi:hypothetical protein
MTYDPIGEQARDLCLAPDRPQTYGSGRICEHEGCGTILSAYNPTGCCGLHQPEPDYVYCGYLVVTCEHCGAMVTLSRGHQQPSERCGYCRQPRQKQPAGTRARKKPVVGGTLRQDGKADAVQKAQQRLGLAE